MTTSATDAEAIARDLNGATSLVIEQMHEAGMPICMREGETTWRTYHAGFDLSLFAQRITDACCDAILSYLASRREAQEPVAPFAENGYGSRLLREAVAYLNEYVFDFDSGADHELTEFERFMMEDMLNGLFSHEPFFGIIRNLAAPPAPAGEVEGLLTEMQPHIDKIERCAAVNDEWGRVVTGQTDAAREIARIARAALNGGRS